MNFAQMLKRFGPAATLVAIRSAIHEPKPRGYTRAQYDPWLGADPDLRTAWAGVYPVVPS